MTLIFYDDYLIFLKGESILTENKYQLEELSEFALEIVRKAGQKALTYYGKGQPDTKFDEGLITEGELSLMEFFQDELNSRFPDYQVFRGALEDSEYTHGDKRYLWIFDPLDGVTNVQAGIPIWGTSLALVENFWPVCGVIYLPATGDEFQAIAGRETLRGDTVINTALLDNISNVSVLLTYSRFHQQYHTTFPGKIRNMGCTTAHICYVAQGRADAAIIANESYQGLAAARVIIESAGGKIYKMDGTEFFLNEYLDGGRISEHLLVTTPGIINQVLKTLKKIA